MDPKITNNALIILTLFILLRSALVGRQAQFKVLWLTISLYQSRSESVDQSVA